MLEKLGTKEDGLGLLQCVDLVIQLSSVFGEPGSMVKPLINIIRNGEERIQGGWGPMPVHESEKGKVIATAPLTWMNLGA